MTDTAGIRRKRSIAQNVEAYSVVRAMKAIDRAEVVACLLDASEAGVEQDARLLGLVAEKGKALVVVVNKWDLAEKAGATREWYRDELLKRMPFVAFAPFVFVSAKEGRGVRRVLDQAARLTEQYRARFPTHELNELVARAPDRPPGAAGPGPPGEAVLRRPGRLRAPDLRHPVQPARGDRRALPAIRREPVPRGLRPRGPDADRLPRAAARPAGEAAGAPLGDGPGARLAFA